MKHTHTIALGLATAGLIGITVLASAQQSPAADTIDVHVLPVQGNIYMLVGAGGNVSASIGSDGVLLVDTMLAPAW